MEKHAFWTASFQCLAKSLQRHKRSPLLSAMKEKSLQCLLVETTRYQ